MRKKSGIKNVDNLKRCYQKNPDLVFRKIADEVILVPIRHNIGDLESIYTLNEVAARIWELIDGKKNMGEIGVMIVEEFEVTPEEAEKDIIGYLGQLEEIKAVTKG